MTNTTAIATTISTLMNLGYSLEEAATIAKALNPTEAAKPSKSTKSAKPTKEPTAKQSAKPSKSTKSKSEKPTKAELDREAAKSLDGKAILAATKFAVSESTDSRDNSKVWLATLGEGQARLSKPEWLALTNYLGAEYDCSYYRGNWQFRFDPTKVLNGGKLSKAEAKAIADRKAARKAAKAAAKAK
jgi:hypothetical protein